MKKIISILLLAISTAVFAQSAPQGYLTDSNGQIVRSGTGLCWHTGYWTPANAVEGCDPVAKAIPVAAKVTLQADTLFDFDKATLKPEGKVVLNSIIDSISGMNVDIIAVTGYTDRIGDNSYNVTLSQKRADAVKSYLVQASVNKDRIVTQGKGKSNPVTGDKCKGSAVTNKLIQCLAPDRRAIIEIVGTK